MGRVAKGKSTTYIDFGKVQSGMRSSYAYHTDQEAYDFYMGARYLQDMMFYKEGKINSVFQPEDLRDNKRKYAGLVVCKKNTDSATYFEVGSSCLGVIEALEYLNIEHSEIDLKSIKFLGVDNSKWMNYVAVNCHKDYKVQVFEDAKDASHVKCDFFFAKGVSLMYAYQDEESMCNMLKNTRLAVFDYTFSKKGKISEVIDTGLGITYLNYDRCKEILDIDGKVLVKKPYLIKKYNQGGNKISYDCIYGDKDIVDHYLSELENRTGENLDNYGDPKFIRQEDFDYY